MKMLQKSIFISLLCASLNLSASDAEINDAIAAATKHYKAFDHQYLICTYAGRSLTFIFNGTKNGHYFTSYLPMSRNK